MTHKQTKQQRRMVFLFEQYKKMFGVDAVDTLTVAQWAFSEGLWKRPPVDPVKTLKREIARALRGQYIEDPQGRGVRKNHPLVTYIADERKVIWVDIQRAKPEQMRVSMAWRRNGVLADCKQMALDFDSYNDNNRYGITLPPLDCNFNPDIEEARLPTKYPEEAPTI
jgi:hypothetical protein